MNTRKHNKFKTLYDIILGPLVCEGNFDSNSEATSWYLFGVTSFGALDCGLYSNSVYTKVSNYVDWLRNTTGMK